MNKILLAAVLAMSSLSVACESTPRPTSTSAKKTKKLRKPRRGRTADEKATCTFVARTAMQLERCH